MNNWKNLHKDGNLSVGMWPKSDEIYFTWESKGFPESPEDVEFSIQIKDLKRIIEEAEMYEKGG